MINDREVQPRTQEYILAGQDSPLGDVGVNWWCMKEDTQHLDN